MSDAWSSQNRIFVVALVVLSVAALALLLQPTVEERLAPRPETAWVAIEVDGGGLAEVRRAELEVGTPFRLYAVLEARDRDGEPVYYTTAPRLRIGDEEIAPERLRTWDRGKPVKVRWFTVEGERPFVELDAETGIGGFRLREFLRSDWPVAWSIPGEVDAAHDNHLENGSALPEQLFGTQRYHVRIEIYSGDEQLIPELTVRSWGIAELKENVDRFPTVSLALPGAAGPASRVFGLTQLAPPPRPSTEVSEQIEELARHRVAFSLATVLRDQIRGAGKSTDGLDWRVVDLRGEARWGENAAAGDLLRVGDRVVVLYEDRGEPGVVDYGDLSFDFARGAVVRPLGEVFAGAGEAVELASLGP